MVIKYTLTTHANSDFNCILFSNSHEIVWNFQNAGTISLIFVQEIDTKNQMKRFLDDYVSGGTFGK